MRSLRADGGQVSRLLILGMVVRGERSPLGDVACQGSAGRHGGSASQTGVGAAQECQRTSTHCSVSRPLGRICRLSRGRAVRPAQRVQPNAALEPATGDADPGWSGMAQCGCVRPSAGLQASRVQAENHETRDEPSKKKISIMITKMAMSVPVRLWS